MDVIDLRPGTVTLPSQPMREAMARAPVGDGPIWRGPERQPPAGPRRRPEGEAAAMSGDFSSQMKCGLHLLGVSLSAYETDARRLGKMSAWSSK